MLRLVGYLCLLIGLSALALAGWTIVSGLLASDGDIWIATGLWWFQVDPDSLQLLQPAIERHVSVGLYQSVIQPMLEAPLIMVTGIFGLVMSGLGWLILPKRR